MILHAKRIWMKFEGGCRGEFYTNRKYKLDAIYNEALSFYLQSSSP